MKKAEFKGTKNEWTLSKAYFRDTKGPNNAKWIMVKDDKGNTIAEVKGIHHGIKDTACKANAQVIVKAPEMLEMLNNYLSDLINIIPKSEARDNRIASVIKLVKEATHL